MNLTIPRLTATCAVIGLLAFGTSISRADDTTPPGAVQDTASSQISYEKAYLDENNTAMDEMMADMEVKPSGDVDRDFVAMMTPHHQGAIDMALAMLKYGKNEQLKRIAQEIIVDQQQEIAAMKLAIGDPLPPSEAVPTQVAPGTGPAASMKAMDPNMKM